MYTSPFKHGWGFVVGLGCTISRNSRSINKRLPISLKNYYHKSFISTVAHAFLVY